MKYKISDKIKQSKRIKLILAIISCGAVMSGCGSNVTDSNAYDKSSEAIATVTSANREDMFTDRDYDTTYEDAVKIVLADEGTVYEGKGVSVTENNVTIDSGGTFIVSGELSNGQLVVDADETEKVQLVLDNAKITCEGSAAIYVKEADKVFFTTAAESINILNSTGEFVQTDENNIDGTIFSKSDITFNGNGKLEINCEVKHGIVSKDDLKITGGSYKIKAAGHGLSGKDSIRVAGGDINIDCSTDGFHSENSDDEEKGYIYICGGDIAISAEDDGIHAGSTLDVIDGNINISKSYEGLEGASVNIEGGIVKIVASDDGVNAAGGNDGSGFENMKGELREDVFASETDYSVNISGGYVSVNANGDGIDSNGSLYISGGEIYVSGPTNGGNGSLDYTTTGSITGGTIVATGASGMSMNFDDSSTQGSILYVFDKSLDAGTEVKLTDGNGNVIVSFTPEKPFQTALISDTKIVKGETYNILAGGESYLVEMTDLLYGTGEMQFGGRGGKGGMRPDGDDWGKTRPEMPEDFDGQTRPEMPEDFDGQTRPDKSGNSSEEGVPDLSEGGSIQL